MLLENCRARPAGMCCWAQLLALTNPRDFFEILRIVFHRFRGGQDLARYRFQSVVIAIYDTSTLHQKLSLVAGKNGLAS
jgi:hypothetical protein